MASARGYRSYRGRSPRGHKVLAAVLLVVILGALAVIGGQRYVVYDESGRPHLELPWQEEETPQPPQEELDLTIEDQPEEKPSFQAVDLAGTELPPEPPEGTAAVITMKTPEGPVATVSAAALEALRGEYPHLVARMSCFLDPAAAQAETETLGLKNSGGYLFYDARDKNWLDPGKPAARTYLVQQAVALAEQGFDELLLTEVSYPTAGKLHKVDDGGADRTASLKAFLEELRAALDAGEREVQISLEVSPALLETGSDQASGQVLSELAPLVDRICAPAQPEQIEAFTQAAGETEFVPILQSGQVPEGQESWIVPAVS